MSKKCIKKIIAFTMAVALLISGLSNPAINRVFADAASGGVTITSQPQDVQAEIGKYATISVKATGKGLSYQWQLSNDGGKTWSKSSAYGNAPDNIKVLMKEGVDGRQYRCVITDSEGNTVTSEAATISLPSSSEILKITSQPKSVSAKEGDYVTLSVKATGKGLSYQWQLSNDGGKTWSKSSAYGNAPDNIKVLVKNSLDGRQYRCVIKDSEGNTVTSEAATISLSSSSEILKITSQPKSVSAKEGDYVTLSVKATGKGLTYQWQLSNDGGKTWSKSSAYGNAPDNIKVLVKNSLDGRQYRCVIKDSEGNTVTSEAATISLSSSSEILKITSQPKSVSAKEGDYVTLSVKATGKGLTYQWQLSNDGGKTWSKSSAYGNAPDNIKVLVKNSLDGRQYRCVITDSEGNTITSEAATLTIKAPATTEKQTTPSAPTTPETSTAPSTQIIEVIGETVQSVQGNVVTFVWGQNDDQINAGYKYNVYIDNKFYNTYDGATAVEYAFDKAGEHKITIKAFYNGVESTGVVLSVTTEGGAVKPTEESSTPKQTTTEEETTPKPTEGQQPVQPTNPTLPNVEGLIHAPAADGSLPYYFAWAPVEGAEGYHVYVNSTKATDVTVTNVNLDASLFAKEGIYKIGVQAYAGNEVSEITTIEFKVGEGSTGGENPSKPTETPEPQQTTNAGSTGTWTVVDASDGKVSYKDAKDITVVNVQQPGWASQSGVYAYGTAGVDHVSINGVTVDNSKVAIDGAGVIVYLSAINSSDTNVVFYDGNGNTIGSVVYKKTDSSIGGGDTPEPSSNVEQPVTQAPDDGTFPLDSSIAKPFGIVLSNPDTGILHVVWGQGDLNCYNVYIDGVRKKTKVTAAGYQFAVKQGNHTVAIATVNPNTNRESERITEQIYINGSAEETTDYPENLKPQIDTSIPKENGKMILQLNNKTNGKWNDDQIYWVVIGRDPQTHQLCYLDLDGNLVKASSGTNDTQVGKGQPADRVYAKKIVHTLGERHYIHLPAIEAGRMYLSYGEPVYITFNTDGAGNVGFAGPDTNNPSDANAKTLFEYIEFTTESVNGGITFHGNTTRVDFFSFPYMTRLTDQYGGFDRCVGDIGTRDELFNAYKNSVSEPFKGLADDIRINAPAKTLFREGAQYANYYDDYINRFWSKYSNEDLVFTCEGGEFRGRVQGDRMRFTRSGSNLDFWVDKPSTQDVLEGRGAFDRGSSSDGERTKIELVIEAQLCAAFTRGIAMQPENWGKPSTYYKSGEICNEYAKFFHEHSVSGKAYGFCYDDVNDQSTLVECGNAANWTIDLGW